MALVRKFTGRAFRGVFRSGVPLHMQVSKQFCPVARELGPVTVSQLALIYLTHRNPNVGAGLPAKAACQSTQVDRVHIYSCGNGHLGFRPDGGSLLKSAKVSKTLLPYHSAPRLGSVCP